MKRLTFDRAFDLCMEQWDWVVKRFKAGDERPVGELKKAWLKKRHHKSVYENCFFCEYAYQRDGQLDGLRSGSNWCCGCSECPGRLVSPTFHCERHLSYHWSNSPLKFYAKLLKLNRKRKATQ